jgi:DNA-binding transcriptional MerR regulator
MLFYLNHQKNLKILLILKMTEKSTDAYKTIGEVVKILNLKSRTGLKTPTHTIRFWEKEFKQIKPKILNNNRRYYDKSSIDLLKKIKFLLKDQGMTINGVKKLLNSSNSKDLDEISNKTIRTDNLKNKINKISNIIKELKKLK